MLLSPMLIVDSSHTGVFCVFVLCALGWSGVQGFYDHTDEVYDLTPANFQKLVLDSHFVWIVEFYAPW